LGDKHIRETYGRITLKQILEKYNGGYRLDSYGSGQRQVTDSHEKDNEPSGSVKCWEFLEWLSDCWLLKKGSTPWS
jgi:hypothetical protein